MDHIHELDRNLNDHLNSKDCEYYTEDTFNAQHIDADTLSIIHVNSRSLYSKLAEMNEYLNNFKKNFNIIAVTETWFRDDIMKEVTLNGCELFAVNRSGKRGGGVALYVSSDLKCKPVKDITLIENNGIEIITVEIISTTEKNILISCVYRPPDNCVQQFTDSLMERFERHRNKKQIICGDFNINLGNKNDYKVMDFLSAMNSMGLFHLIHKPTRITAKSATIIDNIFTNITGDIVLSGILQSDISDHLPIFAVCRYKHNIKQSKSTKMSRNRSVEALRALNEDLTKQNWDAVYVDDVNEAYNAFINTVIDLYNKNCALITNRKKSNDKPWMTKGIKNACKKKNYLYRNFLKEQTKEAENKYKKYKNKLVWIIRNRRKDYYSEQLNENRNNIKSTWGILNKVLNTKEEKNFYPKYFVKENIEIHDEKEITNEFCKYFTNVGPNLTVNISKNSNIDENLINNHMNSIFLEKVEKEEILKIVQNFGNKRSTDGEGLDMIIVKSIIEFVIEPFTYICNLSLTTGVFPDKMKLAKVIPLYKSGDKHNFSNYRPISLLPQFSKILEKVFSTRLDNFLQKHKILDNSQYGFRANHSTALAIMEFTEKIATEIDNNNYFLSIFIDLQKAFDVINHSKLLKKMNMYGIRGVAHHWLSSYLENRNQYVHINDTKSELWQIKCGVPQGSILGPKLFILYMNDFSKVSNLGKILFADDTTLFHSGKSIQEVTKVVNEELEVIKHWFDLNGLILNAKKTNFMLFNNKKEKVKVKLKIDGVEIHRVRETKFLGVMIDDDLKWKSHI
uniref:Reverse transcriptase domain-containing protein n=1 Tax=Salarias fasciatus TaxID=181472 RepID=A0A672HNX1_SALFA